jgi:hypothetical protein
MHVRRKNMTRQRIALISLISIIIFVLLLGGELVYKNKWVNGTLTQESQQISGVQSAEIVKINGQSELLVQTGQINNLQTVSQQLQRIANKQPIRFIDHRTPELEKIFQQMQFPLQEAIVRGNFTEMEQALRELADKEGVKMTLTMDSEAIYMTLDKENGQLVAVIERHGRGIFLPSRGA